LELESTPDVRNNRAIVGVEHGFPTTESAG
jgi:hypothetical protein